MVPPVISYSVPAIVLNCITSVLTQRLRAWQKTERFELNVPHFLQLFIFAIIATPLNYRWQIWLERKFPGRKLVPKPKTRNEDDEESQQRWQPSTRYGWRDDEMAVRNWPCILYRWFTDCVIGSTFNAVLFLVCVGIMKNKSPEQIANDIVTVGVSHLLPLLLPMK